MKFAGQVVCITGAAAGIGRCMVFEFGRRAAQVIAIDRDEERLKELSDVCKRDGIELHCIHCDVTNSSELHLSIDSILKVHSQIDVWINNAGIAVNHRLSKIGFADFQKCIAVNLTALVDATQYVLPHMLQRGHGCIVNMGSIAGHMAPPYMSAYAATKHAVVGFTRSLQAELELEDSPVRAVLVSPGFVETAMVQKGGEMGFPEWMGWMLDSPEKVGRRIVQGLEAEQLEIFPNLNGKTMMAAHRFFPKWTIKSSKILLTSSLKDYIFNRYRTP